ncbi:hypothetical protein MKW94_003144 [Papaver nudicaule]|uniref:Malectin-like domain-containing protein n=1 Tax=Papaver nudicaule TaxID=74823 RepID=A0AA41S8M3_PAPNU|nr:hypothetical protein [Papaver nudicaule]
MGIKQLPFLIIWFSSILCHVTGFSPKDSFLVDCGSPTNTTIGDRVFQPDTSNSIRRLFQPHTQLSTAKHILASTNSSIDSATYGAPLFQTARIFDGTSSYTFKILKSCRHWIRLYFFPFTFESYDMSTAKFSVTTQEFLLLRDFQLENGSVVKEFSVSVTSGDPTIQFTPARNSFAFLNALEVVSVPDDLITDDARNVSPGNKYQGLTKQALQTVWRVNMGGPEVSPPNDTLSRTWVPDQEFLVNKDSASKKTGTVKYVDGGPSPDIAPELVYGSCREMISEGDPNVKKNVTWDFDVDPGFQYLVRFHFCDIVSLSANQLMFNVYINAWEAYHNLDFDTLGAPVYIDVFTEQSESSKMSIHIGPSTDASDTYPNAILNGLEIMKMNDFANSTSGGSPFVASSIRCSCLSVLYMALLFVLQFV